MKLLDKKYVEVLKKLNWHHSDIDENGVIELESWSPAGENITFYVVFDDFAANVRMCAEDFNADNHAAQWVEHRGQNGVPGTIRELLEDAECIKDMLNALADELEKANKKERLL